MIGPKRFQETPLSQYLNWRSGVTAVPKRLKQMVITEEFKSFKDDKIQKSNTFLDSLKSLKSRNIYKILMCRVTG